MDRDRLVRELEGKNLRAERQKTVFRTTELLGRGGNGAAYLVVHDSRELVAKFYIPPDTRDLDDAAHKRFLREIALTKHSRHPYVIRSEGNGTIQIGSYQIPFYLMKKASGTLRDIVPNFYSIKELGNRLRVLLKAMMGVAYLHHSEVVHRDLKPENILVFKDNTPKIADMGIAHINPDFATEGLLTVPSDKLLNREYYAPEQRAGDATKVDHRADIYALGCILYEVITGIPPTRPSLPSLESIDASLQSFDRVFRRMTEHSVIRRYNSIDEAIDDLVWCICESGIVSGKTNTIILDKKNLAKLLRSNNASHRNQAINVAKNLGEEALDLLHEAVGLNRIDVVKTAYEAIGELRNEKSMQILVAGLYPRRTLSKERFDTSEFAAKAILKYDTVSREQIIRSINERVRISDIQMILEGMDAHFAAEEVRRLYTDSLFANEDYAYFESRVAALLFQYDEMLGFDFLVACFESLDRHTLGMYEIKNSLLPRLSPELYDRVVSFIISEYPLERTDLREYVLLLANSNLSDEAYCDALKEIQVYKESPEYKVNFADWSRAQIEDALVLAQKLLERRKEVAKIDFKGIIGTRLDNDE